jgi:hypothetical protein
MGGGAKNKASKKQEKVSESYLLQWTCVATGSMSYCTQTGYKPSFAKLLLTAYFKTFVRSVAFF